MCAVPVNPCEGISLGIKLPTLECTDGIHPNFGNLVDFGRGIGSLPGQLARMADCVTTEIAAKIQKAIDSLVKLFESIFGTYPWSASTPLFKNIKIPEVEMEVKVRALFHEFKIYLLMKFLNILAKFVGPILNIPIPFLSGCVLGDLLTPEGREKIKATIDKNIDTVSKALGLPWDITFSGELGMNVKEFRVQTVLTNIYNKIQDTLTDLLFKALNALLAPINAIIKTVIGIALPIITEIKKLFDFEKLFSSIWDQVKNLAISIEEKLQKIIDFFLNFDITALLKKILGPLFRLWKFGTKIKDVLKISDAEGNVKSPETKFERVMQGVKSFFTNIVTMIYELFLSAVKAAIKAITDIAKKLMEPIIGFLNALFRFIPFTFCTFLNLVAAPLLGMGNLVKALIPSEIKVEPFVPVPYVPPPPQ